MGSGTGIILNGGSSYGKTTLARALQDLMAAPAVVLGIDMFWFVIPAKQVDLVASSRTTTVGRWSGSRAARSSSSTPGRSCPR
jgi:chloramphenicol 3-O-phosphotransferase